MSLLLTHSQVEYHETQEPAMTPQNLIISRQDNVQGLLILVIYEEVATVTLIPVDGCTKSHAYLEFLTITLT